MKKLILLLILSSLHFTQNLKADEAAKKPNIVFILIDDLRADTFGYKEHPFVETPQIDQLAREGIQFENAFVTTSLCSPSRASFMTGLYMHHHDVVDNNNLMEDVIAAYTDAADYGVAEVTTAATFRLGEVYEQFSADLMDSDRPADLDAAALEQYEILLEEQAFPFEEKAIDLFKANADRVVDGVYDEWVQKSFTRLATLMPARYAKEERAENVVTALY